MVRWLEAAIRTRTPSQASQIPFKRVERQGLLRQNTTFLQHYAKQFCLELAATSIRELQVPPAFERLEHRDLVGILQIRANGNTYANPRDAHTQRFQ
jgi:hypothetical protein